MSEPEPIVFVVDDDAAVRKALRRLLQSVGLQVQTFASAQQFLQAPGHDGPACLVLDVRLPDMSGLELQQKLAEVHSDLPVVFITGHGDIAMSVRAMKAGAQEFLAKPFHDQDLLDAIQRGIEQHRSTRHKHAEIALLQQHYGRLTPQERAAFPTVMRDVLNKQIGTERSTGGKTARGRRAKGVAKIGTESPPERLGTMIGGRWSLTILLDLAEGPRRFSELSKRHPKVPTRSLARLLRNLEKSGLIARSIAATRPPTVTYSLLDQDCPFGEALKLLRQWSLTHVSSETD